MHKKSVKYENKNAGYEIEYNFLPLEKEVVYNVRDDRRGRLYSLPVTSVGFIYLHRDGREIAQLKLFLDKTLKNIGGHEQYQYVQKRIKLNDIDGVMEVYRKIQNGEFEAFGKTEIVDFVLLRKKRAGKMVTDFLDGYLFNTPESREVLNEYLKMNSPAYAMRARQQAR